jgi:hypothetical protein
MKQMVLVAFLFLAGIGSAVAQKNSIVGKWTISSFSGDGMEINLDKPEATKKALAEQLKGATGSEPDSAQVEMTYKMLSSVFSTMVFEFNADGKAIFQAAGPMGEAKSDTASYVVDYAKGTITTTSKEDGEEKKESGKIRFEGDLMVWEQDGKKEIIRLKRIK